MQEVKLKMVVETISGPAQAGMKATSGRDFAPAFDGSDGVRSHIASRSIYPKAFCGNSTTQEVQFSHCSSPL